MVKTKNPVSDNNGDIILNICMYDVYVGVSNRQLVEVLVEADSSLELPSSNDWVVVVVTAIVSVSRFYVQLPLGLLSPITLSKGMQPQITST